MVKHQAPLSLPVRPRIDQHGRLLVPEPHLQYAELTQLHRHGQHSEDSTVSDVARRASSSEKSRPRPW
jgi:hypothetical protein